MRSKTAEETAGSRRTIEPGEIVGLFGSSGSGKTTLSRILSGFLKLQEGAITLQGKGYHPVQLVSQHPEKAVNPRWRIRDIMRDGVGSHESGLLKRLCARIINFRQHVTVNG
ncbi:ATP-binding cassette domain-containing protein [Paenibacillus abyssi]|uniref:ATP-binding cassette domain-containing protein n=1 Tax=Paenibacillus abyssi TaxID=1340531 RepID=UPI00166D5B33|nr:ATP-binding cassette domain-containing protein [Paenibacillus abyssi]